MDRPRPQGLKKRAMLILEDMRSPERMRRKLLEGLRSKRSKVHGSARRIAASQRTVDGKLVPVTGRKRGLARLHRKLTPQEERAATNWKGSKEAKAIARARRRLAKRPFHRQSGKEIRDGIERQRQLRDARRIARRGFQLGEFCPVHDLGLEAPYTCDCPEGVPRV